MDTATRQSAAARPSPPAHDLQEAIRRRAEEIYIRNGRIPGRDVENWMQAEKEVRAEAAAASACRTAVVVRVDGVSYVGEYTPSECDGYTPGEFGRGERVVVRFEGQKMFLTRPNGLELETTVVERASS
ncbi:MAG TPA: DUF2934 domain-containing protein [Verrucomicrobiae bacterium]|nr:DUF2934 domain-containing protein [Verrucomicrobiae bacterium]